MNLDNIMIYTDVVPIYNSNGVQIDEVKLSDKIIPTPRRRCACSKNHIFYKGAGIIYRGAGFLGLRRRLWKKRKEHSANAEKI